MEVNNKKYNQENTQLFISSTNQDIADNTDDIASNTSSLNTNTFNSIDEISFVENTSAGTQTTDVCMSVTLNFQGAGGTLSGVNVDDGFIISYASTNRNNLNTIEFTVPTSPDANGNQRVILGYSKK